MLTYYVQLQSKYHLSLMRNIPIDFEVCDDYLDTLDKEDFIEAFRTLHHIFSSYYETAFANPKELNLPCYNIADYRVFDKVVRDSEFSLLWLPVVLFAIGNASELHNIKLIVNTTQFKANLKGRKIKHLPYQIKFLEEQGFLFTNWNGKNFSSKEETFLVEYPDNPNLFVVLKAATNKVHEIETNSSDPQKFDFYRITQFPHMLESLFKNSSNNVIPYTDEYMIRILDKPYSEFLPIWNTFMKEQGLTLIYDPSLNKNRYLNDKGKDSLNFIEYTTYRRGEDGICKLMLRLKLYHPDKYMDYIESLPSEIKSSFHNVSCGHCSENCPRRITYTIDDEYKECCGCFGFEFFQTFPENIDYYKQLFLLEKEYKK